ncbi:MAG: tetratricopeptide repeat protein [bacterium]|nr:tetratricopeptide repeat protein [bacterium]
MKKYTVTSHLSPSGGTLGFALLLLLIVPGAAWAEGLPVLAATVLAADDEAQGDDVYREGRRALDDERWADAAGHFDQVVGRGDKNVDAALYWKAYALSKQGRLPGALAVLLDLERAYPDSRWSDDARALKIEIHQASGKAARPESEDDEELKLLALNSLLHVESERAVELLERFLTGDQSQEFKEHALFVLSQSESPRAFELLVAMARGESGPELQAAAVQILGMFENPNARPMLEDIYASTSDPEIKAAVLEGLMMTASADGLLAIISEEKNPELRAEAIQKLGMTADAGDALRQLYREESAIEIRYAILEAMMLADAADFLIEIVQSEGNEDLRRQAIESLGFLGSGKALDVLDSLYRDSEDFVTRQAVIEAFSMNDDTERLLRIARNETDARLRREAIERLSMTDSEEAVEFMMELLEQ